MIEARDPTKRHSDTLAADGLFVSTLQRSDAPGADIVAKAITATMRKFGAEGCTSAWRRSSATIRKQPPRACAGSSRCSVDPIFDHSRRVARGRR